MKNNDMEQNKDNLYVATILFADLAGCSEISNNVKVSEYNKIIREFHEISYELKGAILSDYSSEQIEFKASGDEVCIILHSGKSFSNDNEPTEESERDVGNAIRFAVGIKLKWLLSEYNIERIKNRLNPRNLGIGIHSGIVVYDENPLRTAKSSEGYAINLAKRIEGASRSGKEWQIFLSAPVKIVLENISKGFTFMDKECLNEFKGISTPPVIYELTDIPKERM
ncbi:MAG: hypothetical protein HY279_11715 [Nitrospinae bacterium]|nr:hypothetical protein [Nitrospinota bacterium]